MVSAGSGSGLDLALDLPTGAGRRAALEAALREAIRSGRLREGAVLPSSRSLAGDLGVSRGTVTAVYEQLVAEGWLVTRRGAVTAVAAGPRIEAPSKPPDELARHVRFDFHPGLPDLDAFPRREWTLALRQALNDHRDGALGELRSGDPQGQARLRSRLVEYLARVRGLLCQPDDLVICSGFTQGLALVMASLRRRGARTVALEDPCLSLHRDIVRSAGLAVVAVPVDDEGLRVDLLPPDIDAVVVTPAHQFPTGVMLSPERRRALVAHATRHDIWIVEDDYLGEFRYDRNPLGALQALAPDQVVYAGSVSKALAPGLRLGWLAPPPTLRPEVVAAKRLADNGTSALDQLAFSEMLANGTFSRHLRRQRARYRRRRDQLVAVLHRDTPAVRTISLPAGLYILAELPDGSSDEATIIADAANHDMRLLSIVTCWYHHPPPPRTLAIGYTAPADHTFRQATEALARLLADHIP